MMIRSLLLSLLVLGPLASSGCKGKHHKKASTVQYFIHGDPLSLVKDTETAPSFLTPANMASYDGFHFSGASSFIEREPVAAPSTYEQIEKDNATDAPDTEVEEEFELLRYAFTQESATRFVYAPQNGKEGYALGFELRDGLLVMVDFDGYPVTSQHYSLKEDGKAFSILVSYEDPTIGKLLTAFYFASSETVNPIETASKDFAFLFDTVKVRWDEPIKLETCGVVTEANAESITASVNAWFADANPTATQRPVIVGSRATHAPFSDLNQHCIFLINDFKLENSTDFYTAGVTLPVINLASKRIVDSDVMLFMDHYQVAIPLQAGEESPVLMHELGHFYGLGHEFKTDATGAALHPSIMGYSQASEVITSWDYEAIRDLYGESLTLAP